MTSSAASREDVFAGREGERVYAADGDIIRGRDRLLGRRAEPVRARVARAVPRRQVHRHRRRARAVLQARAEPVLLHAERRHRQLGHHRRQPAARCAPRARPTSRYANGNVRFVQRPTRWRRASSSRRTARGGVRRHPAERGPALPTRADSQQFYLSYAEGLSAPRTDNLYSVRRRARRQHRPPDAGIGDHQVLRSRLAPESPDAPSPRWRSTTSTTPTASCPRSTRTSASASTATSAT